MELPIHRSVNIIRDTHVYRCKQDRRQREREKERGGERGRVHFKMSAF